MAFSQGSRAELAYLREPANGFGLPITGTPALTLISTATHNLGPTIDYIPNPVLRSDRQKQAPSPGNESAFGQIVGPLHWQGYDAMLEGLFCNPWVTAGATATLTNGVIRNTFQFERRQMDNNIFGLARGMFVNSGSFVFAAGSNVDCTFDLIGREFLWNNASIDADGPAAAPSANSLMKPGVGEIKENGTKIAIVTSCTLNISNSADPNYVYGSNFMPDFSVGDFTVTGSLTCYWPDRTLISKFKDNVQTSLEITAFDKVNRYVFSLPRVTFTGGDAPVTQAGSITVDIPFEATLDPTLLYTARITRS